MTTTRQHIEDLDVDKWATLIRLAAADSLAAAERLGIQPRAESVALAGMSQRELVEHRERNGPPVPRRSLAMQLVEADHLRRVAEDQAREAHQSRLDAEAAAALARGEAGESARVATAAGERVRAVEAEAARKDVERAAERVADQEAVQQAQAEIQRLRAGAAADAAAAEEKVRAADARALERSTERTTERTAGEKTVQQLQAEIARVRAGAAAEVAAAEEKVRAAEARAEQRSAERTTERATGEEAVQRVRLELEKVRSDAAAEVAAARGQASGDVAAAREAADAEVAAAREAADAEVAAARQAAAAEVAHWRAHAANMERWARGEVSTQMLTIPIPPWELRNRIGTVENTVDALYQIDYVLEVGLAEEVESQFVPDLEFTRNLTWKVQQQARDLTSELANLPSRYTDPPQVGVATGYAEAAGDAYRAILQRIDSATQRLGSRFHSPDAEIIAAVTAMLADLRAQGLY
jgi:colicin import membrane protein